MSDEDREIDIESDAVSIALQQARFRPRIIGLDQLDLESRSRF